jgi:outer membrane protein TolC
MYFKQFLVLIFLSLGFTTMAQDTSKTLNSKQVISLVRKFHPIVKQTEIYIEESRASLLLAKGAFDPLLQGYSARKTLDGVNYYNYNSPSLTIPTWFGIELQTGVENLSGSRLNPSQTSGSIGYLGASIPLAKDLIIDKRRAALKQAKIVKSMALVDQKAVVNDLLMNTMEAYWQWVKAYQTYEVVKNNVTINQTRFELVKKSYLNGERAGIDTLEAMAQLQSFQYLQNMRWLEFQNAGLQLSTFLWTPDGEPYNLPENIIPQKDWETETVLTDFNVSLNNLLEQANQNHPELQLYDYKLDVLAIESKLKFQELLPKLDFQYNYLSKGYANLYSEPLMPLFENNYNYALKFEVPLRLSQGRGSYKLAKLKIQDTELSQDQKRIAIQAKVKSYYNEMMNLQAQIDLQTKNYGMYQQLVKAEEGRFFNGESSLFVINSRENKALEALEKLIELKTKYSKTLYALQWSAGLLQ